MEYVIFSLLTWLVLSLAGLPICLTVLPVSLRRYSLQFSPLLGFSYFAFISYYLYRMNIGGTDRYALLLFLIPIIVLLALYVWREATRRDLAAALNLEAAWIVFIVVIALAVVSAPFYVAASGKALALAMSNLDIAELAVVSRYLQEFSPHAQDGFLGQSSHLVWTCQDVWFGPSDIVAIVSSLLHAEPYQLQTLVMDVIAVQAVGFVYLLARLTLDFGKLGSSVIALLYMISPVPLFTIWQSFGGQMFAMSLMLALFVVQTDRLKKNTPANFFSGHLCVTVIILSGIILSYHFMVLVSGLLIVAYFACHALFSRQWRDSGRAGLGLLLAVVACALLNPLRVKGLIGTWGALNSNNGWFISWISPDIIMGANSSVFFAGVGSASHGLWWAALASTPFLLGIWQLARNPQAVRARSFFFGLMLPAFLIGVWFAFREQQNGTWGSYRSFKISSSFSALTLLGGAIAFAGTSWRHQRFFAAIATLLVAITFSVSVSNIIDLGRFSREHAFLPGPEYVALKKIESMPFVKGINVMDTDAFSLLWTNYFTLKTRQVYQKFPYGGRPVGTLNQEYSLTKNTAAARSVGYTEDIFSVETSSFEVEYPLSSIYVLYKARPNRDISITPAEGWWAAEPTHRWNGSAGAVCSIYLDTKIPNVTVQLDASYLELREKNLLTATINGDPLELTHDRIHLLSKPFQLRAGRNIVEFHSSLMPSAPSAWDPRTLSIAWTSMIVRFVETNHP